MTGLIAVLRHEVAQRRQLLLAGALVGLMPFAAPLVSGTSSAGVPELRDTVALFLAAAFSGLAAIVLGATVIGADLAEGRLGFFFSRPLAGWAIWGGKLGGAMACAWAAGGLALLPALLAAGGGRLLRNPMVPAVWLGAWALALPIVALAGHAGGIMLRTRSGWLIFDLLAAATVAGLVWTTLRRLLYWQVRLVPAAPLAMGVGAAAGMALLAASAAQVLGGRTDPARGHRFLSLTLAVAGLALALALAGAAQWQIAVSPQDLVAWTWLQAAPGDGWVMAGGRVRGPLWYSAWFFVQPASGRWLRVRRAAVGYPNVAFSADGGTAVWPEQEAPGSSGDELVRLDLDRAGAAPVRTAIPSATPNSGIAVSPHGTRVALVEKQRVSIFDLAGGRLLAAHSFDGAFEVTAQFTGEDSVRLLVTRGDLERGGVIDVYDLDAGARQPVKRSSIPELYYQPSLGPRLDRLVLNHPAIGASLAVATVFDLTTGRRLAELREPGAEVEARYLSDGRLAETVRAKTGTQLAILDGGGRPQAGSPRYRFPAGSRVLPLQVSADRLLVRQVLPAASSDRERRSYLVLDLSHGTARTLAGPLALADPLHLVPPADAAPLGASPLFVDGKRFLRIDLETGQRHDLGPARQR